MKLYNTIKTMMVLMVFMSIGCTNTSSTTEVAITEPDHLISITQKQFEAYSMKIGEVTSQIFDEEVICNGYITSPTNGMAQISTHISGIVETINCTLGDYVKEGQVLSTLSSNKLIILQQNFIETSITLSRLKSEYERSKTLLKENIGSKKEFIAIESEYKALAAKYNALKLQLKLLTLNVSIIEGGEFYSVFPITAPIDGYITNINIVIGQTVDLQKNLIEIVDVNKLQLQLSIFESDVKYLKVGQNVVFSSPGNIIDEHKAILASIGKTVNMELMTIVCTAKILDEDMGNFINNSFVKASIIVSQKEVQAIPNDAIVKSGDDYYVFIVEKMDGQIYYLQKVKVDIGIRSKYFTEIIDGGDLTKVLISGVYNL